LPDTRTLVDIYAGVGLFGIGLHRQFERVVLVESSPHAVQNARRNLAHNQIVDPGPVEILQGGAEEVLQALDEGFDVAVIDPPRQGCQPDVLAWLTAHVRRQVLYVSCNPTTLARDLKLLVQDGWQIQTIQPLDMFPQTYHIETVVSLTRPA
jgi:23S rRNA (uracil1939-C5)-methyltransferase